MKVQTINNYQYQHKNTVNFVGEVILPEKLSDLGKEFVSTSFERINKLVEELPYDVFIKELPKEKSTTPIVFMVKDCVKPKPYTVISLNDILDEFVQKKELEEIKEQFSKKDFDLKKVSEEIVLISNELKEKLKNKPFVPKKIGTPRKPFIKRRK